MLIKEIGGFKGEIVHNPSKPDGMPRKLLDVSRMKALGWKPKVSLEEGIKRTYEWYREGNGYRNGYRINNEVLIRM